jgi:hypothetical protein
MSIYYCSNAMNNLLIVCALLLITGCKKETVAETSGFETPAGFTTYSIAKGAHFSNRSSITAFTGTELSFDVQFDSTCIYLSTNPSNQYDINKLYGFTEGANNHVNSARIGWSWNDGALRLYAYAYANGIRRTTEITSIAIGRPVHARIGITDQEYIFSVAGKTVSLPRAVSNKEIAGYWQYPYFGGDEVAPHTIYVHIKTLSK